MDAEFFIKVASVIFAFSGWFKVVYDHQTSKPKIVGRILNFICGSVTSPLGKSYTAFMMYPYLLNARKNSIDILDYEAYIKTPKTKGWHKISRFYGLDKVKHLEFLSVGGNPIVINGLPDAFIYKKAGPVQQGVPLHGWIPFLAEEDLDAMSATKFKLVCIDASSKRHVIIQSVKELVPLPLMLQIADVEAPADMMPGPGF